MLLIEIENLYNFEFLHDTNNKETTSLLQSFISQQADQFIDLMKQINDTKIKQLANNTFKNCLQCLDKVYYI